MSTTPTGRSGSPAHPNAPEKAHPCSPEGEYPYSPEDAHPGSPKREYPGVRNEAVFPLFSRRQLGVIAGGGAFLLAGAAGTLAWARANTGTGGRQTSFGTVEIRKAERRPRLAAGDPVAAGLTGSGATANGHGHGGTASLEPGNHTWADVVLVELEVRNLKDVPVLLSPGQLRLKVGDEGMSVTPNGASRAAGTIEAGATERFSISYLAPSSAERISAEFNDLWKRQAIPLQLPRVRMQQTMEARL